MVIVVNKLAQLPHQAVAMAEVVITSDGKVLKHRYAPEMMDPRKVKRALRLLGVTR